MATAASHFRSFLEILRVIDSLQLALENGIATPAGWESSQDVLLPTGVSDEEAKARCLDGFDTRKPHLRVEGCPGDVR